MTALETVAFDIETTGFRVEDQLIRSCVTLYRYRVTHWAFQLAKPSVLGPGAENTHARPYDSRWVRLGYWLPTFPQYGGTSCPTDPESRVNDELTSSVSISIHKTEQDLLSEMTAFVRSTLTHQEVKLVAYNGERWNGGFDLPFLRTRLCSHEIDWPFTELPYIDAMDVFETWFNTTEGTLTGVYDELIGNDLSGLDPFADSKEAVEAWEHGEFEPLVLHNVTDIRRTRALMQLAERYCSKSHFTMRSLDPVV